MNNAKIPPSSLYDFLFNRLGKEGVFALLFIATLSLLLYGGWQLAHFAQIQAADYMSHQKTVMASLADANKQNADATSQVADAVSSLVGFHESVASEHRAMIEGLSALNDYVGTENSRQTQMLKAIEGISGYIDIDDEREQNTSAKLDQLIQLMEQANKLMSQVPGQREAELTLLRQIDEGIQQLREELQGCSVVPSEEEREP